MRVPKNSSRGPARLKPTRTTRPSIEGLEDRLLMYAVTGGKFTYGSRITYSFVPDGTNLGGPTSNLFATMDAKFGRAAWQAAFATAAATWEYSANVNLVKVSDNGAPLGSAGNQQGDTGFGDIRIGGYTQGNSTLAWAYAPPPANGGTLAGDILFNTNQLWQINHDYDLQTVATHEFGHSLGLDHSSFQTAEMFPYYQTVRQALTTDDVNGIQSIWGPRAADWTSQGTGNATMANAFDATGYLDPTTNQVALASLSINSSTDVHWYKIVTPSDASSTLAVTMQSTNLSMLSPRVQIYTASGSGLVQATAPSSYGTTITASIANATRNTTYYVKTMPANAGASGAGAYGLVINMGTLATTVISPPNTTVASQADQVGSTTSLSEGVQALIASHVPLISSLDEESGIVHIGSISGYGDALTIRPGKRQGIKHVIGFQHPRPVVKAFALAHRGHSPRLKVAYLA